ncbi:MAG: HI0074 family nucleotidyltransferase substrate-binding subunit [Spirochaetes bacterium]|nr:HI0074 family nucleotidyltransferase substrate-binding subunit [Spirochaetota bacterium]
MTRSEIVREVKRIILKHAKPIRIWLYGSEATGEASPTSDIDIAFEDPSFHDLERIRAEIEALPTLVKVDVTNIAFCESRFQQRVRDTGKVLYSATKELRFEDALYNFQNALKAFESVYERRTSFRTAGFGDMYLDILVKRFEFTYEMSWKAIKRYLSYLGIEVGNPRGCFKEAYQQGLLSEEDVWLRMIEQRNLSAHEYNEQEIARLIDLAGTFLEAFRALANTLEAKYKEVRS